MNGARMKDFVAPTSFIVWIVNLLEKTFNLTVLLISTKEMKRSRTMNTPSTTEIFFRFVFSFSTNDC